MLVYIEVLIEIIPEELSPQGWVHLGVNRLRGLDKKSANNGIKVRVVIDNPRCVIVSVAHYVRTVE